MTMVGVGVGHGDVGEGWRDCFRSTNLSTVFLLHAPHRFDNCLLLALLHPCHPLAVTLGLTRKLALVLGLRRL